MDEKYHAHSANKEHGVPEYRPPLILLSINNSAGCAENLDERNNAQNEENKPDNPVAFEDGGEVRGAGCEVRGIVVCIGRCRAYGFLYVVECLFYHCFNFFGAGYEVRGTNYYPRPLKGSLRAVNYHYLLLYSFFLF